MTIALENQLNTILRPIFADEVYPIVHPDMDGLSDSVTNMYCVWSLSGGSTFEGLEGTANLARVRVQIAIYTTDYSQMKTASKAVTAAMDAANTQASTNIDNRVDHFNVSGSLANTLIAPPDEGIESDTKRFFAFISFYCWTRD